MFERFVQMPITDDHKELALRNSFGPTQEEEHLLRSI
jgi:hypothetical protein